MHAVVLCVVALLSLLFGGTSAAHCVTEPACPLSPYADDLVLRNQEFCQPVANLSALQRVGAGCQDLRYCCAQVSDFRGSEQAKLTLRYIGVAHTFDNAATGALQLPAAALVRVEFDENEACVASLVIRHQPLVLLTDNAPAVVGITRHYLSAPGRARAPETTLYSLGSGTTTTTTVVHVDECRLISLVIHAPETASIVLESMSFCLLDAINDACGICNGAGLTCGAMTAPLPSKKRAAASVPSTDDDATLAFERQRLKMRINAARGEKRQALLHQLENMPEPGHQASVLEQAPRTLSTSAILSSDVDGGGGGGGIVKPTVHCHSTLNHSHCLTVFGYEINRLSVPLFIPLEYNYFLPAPAARGQPHFFLYEHEPAAVQVVWQCDKTQLSWNIVNLHAHAHLQAQVSRKSVHPACTSTTMK